MAVVNADQQSDTAAIEVPTGAVFVVQIEEQPPCKALRRVEDEVFLSREQFILSCGIYADMIPGEEGVSRYLRSMLFVPSRQLKRGVKRCEVISSSNAESDGTVSALKQTQRKSKQKERCENRLMSLLFATIYDPATKRCKLVQNVPPLKLRKPDKNGKYRNVSNYTDVRMFLRNSMTTVLAAHTSAVSILCDMLPSIFSPLPTLFTLIGRTFFLILSCRCMSTESNDSMSDRKHAATSVLDATFDAIQDYITTWEKRNFTTDNPLSSSMKAGKEDECYQAIRSLLEAMIQVLPPVGNEPFCSQFQKQELYGFATRSGTKCDKNEQSGQSCILRKNCPSPCCTAVTADSVEASKTFLEALLACAKMSPSIDGYNDGFELGDIDFNPVVFRSARDNTILHRSHASYIWIKENVFTDRTQDMNEKEQSLREALVGNFVEKVRFDVANCWASFGRSNIRAAQFLNTLDIQDENDLNGTVCELVFGGGVAAITLFEREKDIIPICATLRGKGNHELLMVNEEVNGVKDVDAQAPNESTEQATHVEPTAGVASVEVSQEASSPERGGNKSADTPPPVASSVPPNDGSTEARPQAVSKEPSMEQNSREKELRSNTGTDIQIRVQVPKPKAKRRKRVRDPAPLQDDSANPVSPPATRANKRLRKGTASKGKK